MSDDIVKGMWKQLKGAARTQWGKLTDDDWEQIAGSKDRLIGRLQEHYGWDRQQAERDADEFMSRYGGSYSKEQGI